MIKLILRRLSFLFLFSTLLVGAWGCGESSVDSEPGVRLQTSVYSALRSSEALKDSRLRESVPAQVQGSFGQVKFGDDNGFAMDYIIMDSSVTFLDSIPSGRTIVACTLWVKLGVLPTNDGDSVVLDLWSVPESWNEDEVSWKSPVSGVDWLVAGGGGHLFDTALISVKRVSIFSYEWKLNGVLYDTVVLEDGIAVPVPINPVLAQANYIGESFGFALRRNSATTYNALFALVTIDNSQLANRPYVAWIYR